MRKQPKIALFLLKSVVTKSKKPLVEKKISELDLGSKAKEKNAICRYRDKKIKVTKLKNSMISLKLQDIAQNFTNNRLKPQC